MSLYLTTISKVRLLLALYIGAKKTFVRTKFDVKNASSYIFFNLLFPIMDKYFVENFTELLRFFFAPKKHKKNHISIGGRISVLANAF